MAISETKICNQALGYLGAGRISNYETDTSEKAVLCRLYYDSIVEEVLRSHEWNCAIWYQALAQIDDDDDNYLLDDYEEYAYQYQLPTAPKCLRVIEIPDYQEYPYEIVSGYLLSNLSEVTIKYIRTVEDPTKFDPNLVRAMAYRLAAEIAGRATGSKQNVMDILRMYEWALAKAIDLDGRESEQPQVEEYAIRDAKDI